MTKDNLNNIDNGDDDKDGKKAVINLRII